MKKDVKCYIVNRDVSIFQYEILDGVMTNQVEIIGESKKRYIVGNFKTLKEAKEYVENVLKIEIKKESE